MAVGALGWLLAWKSGVWVPQPTDSQSDTEPIAFGAAVLGYASAVCYLGARIPQIIKNQRERSCEGLSLLFFILSLLGNATYGAGILFHSTGTMVEDAVIFLQFRAFGSGEEEGAALEA